MVFWQNPSRTRWLKANTASSSGARKPHVVLRGLLERAELYFSPGQWRSALCAAIGGRFLPRIQDICCADCVRPNQVHTLGLLNVFTHCPVFTGQSAQRAVSIQTVIKPEAPLPVPMTYPLPPCVGWVLLKCTRTRSEHQIYGGC